MCFSEKVCLKLLPVQSFFKEVPYFKIGVKGVGAPGSGMSVCRLLSLDTGFDLKLTAVVTSTRQLVIAR